MNSDEGMKWGRTEARPAGEEEALVLTYDKETDSACIELSQVQPSGTIEISGGANINTTNAGEVVCIELLNAPAEFPIGTLFKFEVEPSRM